MPPTNRKRAPSVYKQVDLILSAHAVGVLAFFAAGASLAMGALSARMTQQRPRTSSPVPKSAKTPEPSVLRVAAVGVLRVEGPHCNRLEDDAAVASSSFHEPVRKGGLQYELAWCARAAEIYVEVGQTRIALDGPLLIEIGSEEHYPGCRLEALSTEIRKRICAARVVSSGRGMLPRHGVFRSLRPGDPVAVAGLVEREGEHGWRLRPDHSGALRIWSRRKPRIRGPFGLPTLYASALCL